jgi:hypothetical protein
LDSQSKIKHWHPVVLIQENPSYRLCATDFLIYRIIYFTALKLISRLLTECVSAPTEI